MDEGKIIHEINQTIQAFFRQQRLSLDVSVDDDRYTISLLFPGTSSIQERKIGAISLQIIPDENVPPPHVTRANSTLTKQAINIPGLFVKEDYRGKKYATLLLIFGILTVLENHPSIEYVTLDDMTNMSNSLKNIYSGLHIVNQGLTHLEDDGTISLDGPEKFLFIGQQQRGTGWLNMIKEKVKNITNSSENVEERAAEEQGAGHVGGKKRMRQSRKRKSKSKRKSKCKSKCKSKRKSKCKRKTRRRLLL